MLPSLEKGATVLHIVLTAPLPPRLPDIRLADALVYLFHLFKNVTIYIETMQSGDIQFFLKMIV